MDFTNDFRARRRLSEPVRLTLRPVVRLVQWRWRGIPVGAALLVFLVAQIARTGGL